MPWASPDSSLVTLGQPPSTDLPPWAPRPWVSEWAACWGSRAGCSRVSCSLQPWAGSFTSSLWRCCSGACAPPPCQPAVVPLLWSRESAGQRGREAGDQLCFPPILPGSGPLVGCLHGGRQSRSPLAEAWQAEGTGGHPGSLGVCESLVALLLSPPGSGGAPLTSLLHCHQRSLASAVTQKHCSRFSVYRLSCLLSPVEQSETSLLEVRPGSL